MENAFSNKSNALLPSRADHVLVGRIAAPWGVRGDVKIEVFSDIPSRFQPGSVLYLKNKPAKVQKSHRTKGGMVIKLEALNNRNDAEALRGELLTVPQENVESLPEGSYYYFQILGMKVQTEEGEHLGTIKEIIETGTNDVYVVGAPDKKDVLIPALDGVIFSVNLDENVMTVNLPEGLI